MDHAVAARRLVEEGPAAAIFADVDRSLRESGESLQVELAEETVAALYDGLTDPAAHTDVTVWIGESLTAVSSATPDSYFGEFADDDGNYDAYEVVDEAATLAFVFDERHEDVVDVPTNYDHLTVGVPSQRAFFDAVATPEPHVGTTD